MNWTSNGGSEAGPWTLDISHYVCEACDASSAAAGAAGESSPSHSAWSFQSDQKHSNVDNWNQLSSYHSENNGNDDSDESSCSDWTNESTSSQGISDCGGSTSWEHLPLGTDVKQPKERPSQEDGKKQGKSQRTKYICSALYALTNTACHGTSNRRYGIAFVRFSPRTNLIYFVL